VHRVERLGEARDGADADRPPGFIALRFRGEKDDRHVGRYGIRLENPAGLVPIEARHHPIQENRVEPTGRGAGDRRVPGIHDLDLHLGVEAQGEAQNRPNVWLVVGAQQPHGSFGKGEGSRVRDRDAGHHTTNPGLAGNRNCGSAAVVAARDTGAVAMMSFAGNEKLKLLRERYRASAGQIVEGFHDIARQLAAAPVDDAVLEGLRRELHRVHGTAGSYGYATVSDLAASLEERVAGWMDDATLEAGQRAALVTDFAQRIDLAFKS
jgi:HPt (histidine-containing phosphotransfer) domain-containing protein